MVLYGTFPLPSSVCLVFTYFNQCFLNKPSEKEVWLGSDAPARRHQSRGGRNGKNTRPDRIGGISWIGTQDKCLGVADRDVQPMEKAGIGIVRFVFMGVALQGRNVIVIAIAVDLTAISDGGMGKFSHGCLLHIGCHPHFQKAGIAPLIQRQRHKSLRLFCAPTPLFPCCWAAKVRNIKFDDPAQLMAFISLAHGNADAPEHGSGGFVCRSKHCHQLNGGNT